MSLRIALFLLVVLLVLGVALLVVHRRLAELLRLGRRGRLLLLLGLGIVGAASLGRRFAGRLDGAAESAASSTPWPWSVLDGLWTGVLLAAGLLLVVDLARWSGRLLGWLGRRVLGRRAGASASERRLAAPRAAEPEAAAASAVEGAGEAPSGSAAAHEAGPEGEAEQGAGAGPALAGPPLGRREALVRLTQGAGLAAGFGLGLWGTLVGRTDLRVETLTVPLEGLPRPLDGYTLVQLSDLHIGTYVGWPELRVALERVAALRPDLVVLTGDLLDHDPAFAPLLGRFVTRLAELPRDGVVAVPGNHDYYAGIEDVVVALRRAGARVLRDDGVLLGGPRGFVLLGVDDLWAARVGMGLGPDLDAALRRVPESADRPRVLLAHNPAFFPEAAGQVQLQLSGHTHGGQINVGTRLPAELVLPYGYVAGAYEREGSLLYVNRGFGTAGPPARVGAPPELTRIVLVSA